MANEIIKTSESIEYLFSKVSDLIEQARSYVKTSINTAEVYTKYYIGKYIVEYEQKGNVRAQYGEQLLKDLSQELTLRYGAGWSYTNLKYIRKFYTVYSKRSTTGCPFENKNANQWLANSKDIDNQIFKLSWTHYLILMRVENPDARSFYEIECVQQQWSKRQLQRQVGSCLYERLALSRDKDEVMRLSCICFCVSIIFARQGFAASQG